MRSRRILIPALALLVMGRPGGRADDKPPGPTCEASLASRAPSKPPANRFFLRLTLRNRADDPRWFVLPHFGNDRLGSDTIRFYDRPSSDPPFESDRYRGRGGDVVVVRCLGSKISSESFNAILVPPQGEVVFEDYEVMTFGDALERLEVGVVSAILVNGRTPLEKWLPYGVASGEYVVVPGGGSPELLDFDRKTYRKRTDYPRDRAESVVFEGARRSFVKIAREAEHRGRSGVRP